MKKLIYISALFIGFALQAQTPTFRWIGGSQEPNKQENLLKTTPGPRQGSSSFVDSLGNFWLYGGFGHDFRGQFGYFDDVWKYEINTEAWVWIDGKPSIDVAVPTYNNALAFDGVDDIIPLAAPPIDYKKDLTIEVSFKATSDGVILSHSRDNREDQFRGWSFEVANSGTSLWIISGCCIQIEVNDLNLLDGKWHHLAVVFKKFEVQFLERDTLKVVIDENQYQEPFRNLVPLQSDVEDHTTYIGGFRGDFTEHFFEGEIDEVRFWSEAKSLSEIISNKDLELSAEEDSLQGYYNFNQGIAESAGNNEVELFDTSPNGISGTLGDLSRDAIFIGEMAEVRLWSSPFRESEIETYSNQLVVGNEVSLEAAYNFNNGIPFADNSTLSTINDLTANNFDANFFNFQMSGANSNFLEDQLPVVGARYPNNFGAESAKSADFNGDTFPDIVTESYDGISLLINDGTGGISSTTEFTAGTFTRDFVIGFFNSDLLPDVAVTAWDNGTDDRIRVMYGDGAGGFSSFIDVDPGDGSKPIGIQSADFNGDDFDDLLVATTGNRTLKVFFNDGVGNFNSSISIDFSNELSENPILGDFNNDGFVDIATRKYDQNFEFTTLMNDGEGNFTPTFSNTTFLDFMLSLDINQDGNEDILYTSFNRLGVLFGNGDGTFQNRVESEFEGSYYGITYLRTNETGETELLIASQESWFHYMKVDESGSFEELRRINLPRRPGRGSIVVEDLNKDGINDLAVGLDLDQLKIFLNENESLDRILQVNTISFDGIDDFIEIPELRSFDRSFTWESWVKTEDNGPLVSFLPQGAAANWESGIDRGFTLAIKDSRLNLLIEGYGEYAAFRSQLLTDGNWHHIALTVEVDTIGNEFIYGFVDADFVLFGEVDFDTDLAISDLNFVTKLGYATSDFKNIIGPTAQSPLSNWVQGKPIPENTQGKAYAAEWTDGKNLFIFGGEGLNGIYNTVQKFNTELSQWETIKGAEMPNEEGNYGEKEVPSAINNPPARWLVKGTLDNQGNYWVFGGAASQEPTTWFNDLWRYNTRTNEWTWMSGTTVLDSAGTYGTRGIPSRNNLPGARENNQIWSDDDGNIWVFGGYGLDVDGSIGYLNDLWKFDTVTKEWTWVAGSNQINKEGNYGELGVSNSGNYPGARAAANQWIDSRGVIWIFGGRGTDKFGLTEGYLNDLWSYNPVSEEWTWHAGSDFVNSTGTYNETGLSSVDYVPGARWHSTEWIDEEDNLWMFGGFLQNQITEDRYNDFWKFEPISKEWTWLSGEDGTTEINIVGVYGELDDPQKPYPGARHGAVTWTDPEDNFWMLGGALIGSSTYGMLTDLWKYEPIKGEWKFIRGSTSLQINEGVYGARGIGNPLNEPKSRWHGMSWPGDDGKLWFFGGLNQNLETNNVAWLNDLWVYDPDSDVYTWMAGSSDINGAGVYGIKGDPSTAHIPGARSSSAYWKDKEGNFWMFGGYESFEYNNDLWRFNPVTLEWTWMTGNSFQNTPSVHGSRGVELPSNEVGARRYTEAWVDNDGFVWIFGGQGYDGSGQFGYLNDLWKYNPKTNLWAWMGGSKSRNTLGTYGEKGIADSINIPSPRYAHTTWTDDSGNLWLFGGVGILGTNDSTTSVSMLNDFWKYDIRTNLWTWMGGGKQDTIADPVFGVQNVFDTNNIMSARERIQKFEKTDKSLFLFGGRSASLNSFNDFWEIRFTPGETLIDNPSELSQSSFTFSYDEPWATSFQIQVSLFEDFNSTLYDINTDLKEVTIGNLTPGTNYYYKLNASNDIGASGFGQTLSLLTLPETPKFESRIAAITNLTSNSMMLNWLPTSGIVDGYNLDISTDSTFQNSEAFLAEYQSKLIDVTESDSIIGLSPGTLYYLRLRSLNESGFSPYSMTIAFLTPPETPTYEFNEVVTEVGQNEVLITWNEVSEILSGYRIIISTDSTFASDTSVLAAYNNLDIPKSRLSIPVVDLTPGTRYYATISAFNKAGVSNPSQVIDFLTLPESPIFPTENAILNIGQTSATVTWQSPAEIYDGYLMEVSIDFSFNNAVLLPGYGRNRMAKEISKGVVSEEITGLLPGRTYYARLRSYNESGDSPNSNIITIITVPVAPTFGSPNNISQTSVSLGWSASTGADTYLLDVSTDTNFEENLFYNEFPVAVRFEVINGLEPGTQYYARIQASNQSGSSGSVLVPDYDSTQFLTIPATPTINSDILFGQTNLQLSWSAVNGADGYIIGVSDNDFQTLLTDYNDVATTENFIQIGDLSEATEYQFRVRSFNNSGSSGNRAIDELLTKPATPTARDATNSSATVFTANWDPVSGEVEYYRLIVIDDFTNTHLDTLLNSAIPVQVRNLRPGFTYRYKIAAGNKSGESPLSNEIAVLAQNNASSLNISDVDFSSEFSENTTSSTVSVTIGGGSADNANVFFRHKGVLATSWSENIAATKVPNSQSQHTFEITIGMLDEIGVVFEVFADDGITLVENRDNVIRRTFSESNSEALPELTLGQWQMISIPYELNDNLVASIFNELGDLEYRKKWRLMTYLDQQYQDQGVGFTRVELGKGYWFNSLKDVTINIGAGTTNSAEEYTIGLTQGWNQIGNPYNIPINWERVLIDNNLILVVSELLVYDSQDKEFKNSNTLQPFEGAFVWSDIATPIVINPLNTVNGRAENIVEDTFTGINWKNELSVVWNGEKRSLAAFGMHQNASHSKDPFDKLLVPRFVEWLDMYTVNQDYFYSSFKEDIRPHENTTVWNFKLETNFAQGSNILSWNTVQLDKGFLWIFDEETGKVVNMTVENQMDLSLSTSKNISIHYSEDPNYQIVPNNFAIGEIYPNPASNHFKVSLLMPKNDDIQIKLIDIQGRTVNSFKINGMEKGVHQLSYDIDKKELKDGIYFVELSSTSNQGLIRKKLVIKSN